MAVLTGAQGNFTFASGDSIANVELFDWQGQIRRQLFPVKVFGWIGTRRVPGAIIDAQVSARAWVTSAGKMTVPVGTAGTLTLTQTSGQTYVFTASLESIEPVASAQEDTPQVVALEFKMNAASSSGTVV